VKFVNELYASRNEQIIVPVLHPGKLRYSASHNHLTPQKCGGKRGEPASVRSAAGAAGK
jgi:hypothetical protein